MPKVNDLTDDIESDETLEQEALYDDNDLGFYSLDDSDEQINVLYYGREGTGKTTSALAMANLEGRGRVLVINAEAGTKKIALRKRGIDTSKIVMWPAPGQRITFQGLEALHRRLLTDLQENPGSWAGMVFDSVTEIVAALRETATLDRQAKLDKLGREYDINLIDRADYGVMTDQLRRIFRRFRDLPCHTVMTALEKTNDETGVIGPDITRALGSSVLGYVDLVIYCRATQEAPGESENDQSLAEFRGLTRSHAKYHAKDRYDITPRVLANPSFERLFGYITGSITEADDTLQLEYNERRIERENLARAEAEEKKAARAERRKRA